MTYLGFDADLMYNSSAEIDACFDSTMLIYDLADVNKLGCCDDHTTQDTSSESVVCNVYDRHLGIDYLDENNYYTQELSTKSTCKNKDCKCVCGCCYRGEDIGYLRLDECVIRKDYLSNYISKLGNEANLVRQCESYFTLDNKVFDREAGLAWKLLRSNDCGKRFCLCICDCCLQEPFKMNMADRIAFEHWLECADDLEQIRKKSIDYNSGIFNNVNPLKLSRHRRRLTKHRHHEEAVIDVNLTQHGKQCNQGVSAICLLCLEEI